MKRKITRVMADGSKHIVEEDDQAPVHHKNILDAQKKGEPPAKQYLDKIAGQGHGGDTKLAHVNAWEEALLKKLGGAGTKNPHTGLKQFYTNPATGQEEDFFNMPLDIMPTSTSESASYSGLPGQYQESYLSTLMPQLQSSIANMPGNIDDYTNQALGSYQQLMNNNLKTNIPKALSNMANRGIINSTEGQNIMGNVFSSAAKEASDKGYTTAMQGALLKANMPSVLAGMADLGKSTGSQSVSQSSDPTVMYRQMADLIKSMM
jgi:hypothetical protein